MSLAAANSSNVWLPLLLLGVGVIVGWAICASSKRTDHWSERWTNWDDVPENIKEDFRTSLDDMRTSMNEMLDQFEEDFE